MLRKIDFSQESQCLSVLLILQRAPDAAGGLFPAVKNDSQKNIPVTCGRDSQTPNHLEIDGL